MPGSISIRVTKAELRQRRRRVLRDLCMSEAELMAKVNSTAPLSQAEWTAMQELAEIDFLLSDDSSGLRQRIGE